MPKCNGLVLMMVLLPLMRAEDAGFDLFFKSNLDEMNDEEIHFENPLPSWLKGTLVRNGLGRFEIKERQFLHAFDGYGKFSSWRFPGNGSSYFSTRFIESDSYKESIRTNDVAPYLLFQGVTPEFNEAQKLECLMRGIDNMNVNVYPIYDEKSQKQEYVALNDFWKVYKFHPNNLTTIGSVTAKVPNKHDATGTFDFLSFISSAHPLPEYGTSNHFTYVSSVSILPFINSTISLIRIKSVEERELVARWPVERVPYMHSFAVTQNYVIFFASPFYVNTGEMVKSAAPFDSLDWYDDKEADVYVVNIHTGKVTNLKTSNMFSMHHVNAFERKNGDEIVVDISTYPTPDFVKHLEVKILLDPIKRNSFDAHALLKRYVIDMTSGLIDDFHFETSDKFPYAVNIDMPVINEKYRFQQYCYVYGIVLKADNISLSRIALAKKNVCGQPEKDAAWLVEGHYPVEPWFVASPGAQDEDDGYLFVPVIHGAEGKSYLAMIDTSNMALVNKAYLPTIVPYSLHGRFFEEIS